MTTTAVIPSKSNVQGVTALVSQLREHKIPTVVVADGNKAFDTMSQLFGGWETVEVIAVPEGAGIHVMWNKGLEQVPLGNHAFMLNDDVLLSDESFQTLEQALTNPTVGMVCPISAHGKHTNWHDLPFPDKGGDINTCYAAWTPFVATAMGTPNKQDLHFTGHAFMLREDLASKYRFDENLRWFGGDDEVFAWVREQGLRVVMVDGTSCTRNESWTMNNDPPATLNEDTSADTAYFKEKWQAQPSRLWAFGGRKKIAVYTITKNEEQFVERWAASAKEADYIVLVDTGSTDSTVSVAQRSGCLVHEVKVSPWRFDDARNAALALVPADADYCISLDADEMLVPGWRQHMDSIPDGVTRPRYLYTWSWNDDGTAGLQYKGDKIHTRHGYRWVGPVHEMLSPTLPESQANIGMEIHHYPDPTKSRAQYLPLLELAVEEDPYNDRNSHYLAREYWGHGMYDKAAAEFKRHLGLGKWDAERARSMLYLSRIPGEDRLHWVLQAISIDQHRRENWYELSKHWYEQADWQQCLAAAEKALSIKDKSLDYMTDPEVWGAPLYDTAALAAWNTGKAELAVSYGEEAVRLSPNDGRLQENLRWYKGLYPSKTLHELGTTTDKSWTHGYLHLYQALFEPIRRTAQTVLEIGINTGDSIRMWRDYFTNAHVYGLDVVDNCGGLVGEDRITATFRDAYTKETVDSFGETRFDVIVEDGVHTLESMRFVVQAYSKLLSTTGILVIEDIPDPAWIQTLAADTPSELRPYIYGVDRRIALSTPSYFNDESMFVIDKRFIRTEGEQQ